MCIRDSINAEYGKAKSNNDVFSVEELDFISGKMGNNMRKNLAKRRMNRKYSRNGDYSSLRSSAKTNRKRRRTGSDGGSRIARKIKEPDKSRITKSGPQSTKNTREKKPKVQTYSYCK
eukprot:TRINITY_DN8092_c0_g1_i1.p1 TRINITY_DN8092_c0_g1~~TRINITY_DN8092_c0_g1_i1.p1  ORF type:complete len:118 (-),score=17.48 TRINITY_DN8092_c0_g1_i1:266-619(-)